MNNGTLNPALFSASQTIKEQVINPINRLKKERRTLKEQINTKVVKNENYDDLELMRQEKKQQKKQKYEEFKIRMKGVLQKFIDNESKNFLRFNEKYYGRNDKLLQSFKELAHEFKLNFKQLGVTDTDIVIYKMDDHDNFPLYLQEKRNENHPRKLEQLHIPIIQEIQQEEKQQPQQTQQQQKGQPPDVIRDIIVHTDENEQNTIKVRFDTPENWGYEIELYRIYLIEIDDLALDPIKKIISEFKHINQNVQEQSLRFVQKSEYQINQNQILFDKMNYISIEAKNKFGWSSEYELCPIKLYASYQQPQSLYLKGVVNPILISEENQLIEVIYGNPQIVTFNNQDHLIIEDFSLVLLDKENLRNVSLKHDSVGVVNTSFTACQWGELLCFQDETINTKYQVNPKEDFTYCLPYQINCRNRAINKIACGFYHSLAITVDGNILSWGYNSHGQLGNGTNISDMDPHEIGYFRNNQLFVVDVQAGQQISMCRTDQGEVYSWGLMQNDFGEKLMKVVNSFNETINLQCVDPQNQQRIPRKINLKAKQITMGYECFGAVSLENNIYMWGRNEKAVMGFEKCHQLDDQDIVHLIDPMRINLEGYQVKEFNIGAYHCVAKIQNGNNEIEYISWGNNDFQQCGQNKQIKSEREKSYYCNVQKITKLPNKNFISFSCGFDHTVFLSSDNIVYTLSNSPLHKQSYECTIFANKVLAGDHITYVFGLE